MTCDYTFQLFIFIFWHWWTLQIAEYLYYFSLLKGSKRIFGYFRKWGGQKGVGPKVGPMGLSVDSFLIIRFNSNTQDQQSNIQLKEKKICSLVDLSNKIFCIPNKYTIHLLLNLSGSYLQQNHYDVGNRYGTSLNAASAWWVPQFFMFFFWEVQSPLCLPIMFNSDEYISFGAYKNSSFLLTRKPCCYSGIWQNKDLEMLFCFASTL